MLIATKTLLVNAVSAVETRLESKNFQTPKEMLLRSSVGVRENQVILRMLLAVGFEPFHQFVRERYLPFLVILRRKTPLSLGRDGKYWR